MQTCYHTACDSRAHNETVGFASLEMLAKVTQTLIDTVVDAAEAKCNSKRKIR